MLQIIAFLAFLSLAILFARRLQKPRTGISRIIPDAAAPQRETNIDKLIIVRGITNTELQQALGAFCKSYNAQDTRYIRHEKVAARAIALLQPETFAIVFPYGLSFDLFCFCVNYMAYPEALNRTIDVTGWCTLDASAGLQQMAGKKAMLYISETDTEYDNVFLTTESNEGFKIDFGGKNQLLPRPEKQYAQPPENVATLQQKNGTLFS